MPSKAEPSNQTSVVHHADSTKAGEAESKPPAKQIELIDADWKQLQALVAQNAGKIVVVDVWSTACEPCMKEFPHLIELHERFADDVVAISFDIDYAGIAKKPPSFYRERVLEFLGSQPENKVIHRMCTTAADELFTELELDSIPAIYVYGRDGQLAKRFEGVDSQGVELSYEKHVMPFVGDLVKKGAAKVEPPQTEQIFAAMDSFAPGDEPSSDARECLKELGWQPDSFVVTLKPSPAPLDPAIVRFPSPHPTGHAINDLVALEWFSAKNEANEIIDAPAIVVVHESGTNMDVGRLIARALHAQGLHAFLIHLPTYGLRRPENFKPQLEFVSAVMKQGIADARRARDAIAVLPHVDSKSISIQGTSLGGFVTATAAGLDRGFATVHIMVAGGNLYEVISSGKREAGKMREMLAEGGYSGEKLRQLVAPIEPLRLAHRYDRKNTWLYTANQDQVIPPERARELRLAAGIEEDHEMILPADHYSGIVYVPIIVAEIAKRIRTESIGRVQTQ